MYIIAAGRLIVLLCAIAVAIDASRLGAKRGRLGGGFLDMGPVAWFFATWLLFVIAFPCYMVARPRLVAANQIAARQNSILPNSFSRQGIPTSAAPFEAGKATRFGTDSRFQ